MKVKMFIAAAAIAAVALAAHAAGPCPLDGSGTYTTGVTRTDAATGKLLWEVKCLLNNHTLWSTEP